MHSTLTFFFFLRDYFSSNSSPEPFVEAQRIHLFVNTPQHVCRVIFFFFQIFIFVFNKMVAHLLLTVLCSCSFHYQTSPFMLSPRLKSKKKKNDPLYREDGGVRFRGKGNCVVCASFFFSRRSPARCTLTLFHVKWMMSRSSMQCVGCFFFFLFRITAPWTRS